MFWYCWNQRCMCKRTGRPSCKEMQWNQRFKFPSVPKQVHSKGKHINSGSPTADISIMTVLLPTPSHASNNLSWKMTFLMLKRTVCIERRRGRFLLCTYRKCCLRHWLPSSDPCPLSPWDIPIDMHTSSSLKKTCYSLKPFASLNGTLPSRTNATYL